ncbi:hypothetical protein KAS50_08665, partial [bacterium]|nr:hypothetical protein [bacterium]
MKRKRKSTLKNYIVLMSIFLLGSNLTYSPEKVYAQIKFSGYMFGDYYYVAKNHNEDNEGKNGFWYRRIYLTADRKLNDEFSVRFRM